MWQQRQSHILSSFSPFSSLSTDVVLDGVEHMVDVVHDGVDQVVVSLDRVDHVVGVVHDCVDQLVLLG